MKNMKSIVIMGVAGCGKSSLGVVLARSLDMTIVEGDDFHSDSSREKMRSGIALNDSDRAGWLDLLSEELKKQPNGVVLTCSALKKAYRERLRFAVPNLRFVFLDIGKEQANVRVLTRAQTHFFASSLIDSQFETLESPIHEAGVLVVDALMPLILLKEQVIEWLKIKEKV
ncbi:MAG: gluconokinase [Methylococcales bacterium]